MNKPALRRLLVACCVAVTAPAWLPVVFLRGVSRVKSDEAFRAGSEVLSLFPGRLGVYLRRGFYAMTLEDFSADCQVAFGTVFSQSTVRIGRDVVLGRYCTIGSADIGDGVAIGSNVDILSGRHQHSPADADTPVQYRRGRFEQMRIGANAWLGNGCVIMNHVGAGAVIGAAAVVVKAIPPGATAVGNPATVKKLARAA